MGLDAVSERAKSELLVSSQEALDWSNQGVAATALGPWTWGMSDAPIRKGEPSVPWFGPARALSDHGLFDPFICRSGTHQCCIVMGVRSLLFDLHTGDEAERFDHSRALLVITIVRRSWIQDQAVR